MGEIIRQIICSLLGQWVGAVKYLDLSCAMYVECTVTARRPFSGVSSIGSSQDIT